MLKIKDFELDKTNNTVLLITRVEEKETRAGKPYCCIENTQKEL